MSGQAFESLSEEARQFVAQMPKGAQSVQARAVRAATDGSGAALARVRASRDIEKPLAAGVTRRYVRPDLCLYLPESGRAERTLLYFHGGCWVFGSINSCSEFCMAVAKEGVAVLAYNYPLAPENRPSAVVAGCCEAFAWARAHAGEWGGRADRVSVGGDSAGGNLSLALALTGGPQPAALFLYYPVTKAWADGSASWRRYGVGFGLDADLMAAGNEAYAGIDVHNPLVSPACATDAALAKLPPCHFLAAGCDILLDQGLEFHRRLQRLGVKTTHETVAGAVHLFVTVKGQPQAFAKAVALAVRPPVD